MHGSHEDTFPAPKDRATSGGRCWRAEEANADLARSVEELEAFVGVVCHDLKTPLTTVTGYTELLTHLPVESRASSEYDDLVAGLGDVVAGMSALVDTMLEYATAPGARLRLARFDLGPLVAEVVAAHLDRIRVHALARADGAAGAEGSGGPEAVDSSAGTVAPGPEIRVDPLPTIFADRAMVRRVLDNLVGNALKYTRPGQAAQVHVSSVEHSAGWVYLEVSDRGIGIPDGRHDAIFAGFHRVHDDARYPGHGLGLALCRRIVERHGGSIGAQPNPGGGTRFWLTLPASEDAVAPTLG